jgi:redox-sensitive bicupin YhaK (pirin superfamily)
MRWGAATMRLIAGEAYGLRAPAKTYSPMFYCAVEAAGAAQFDLPAEHAERAVYVVEGEVAIDDAAVAPRTVAVLGPAGNVRINAGAGARLMLFGGAAMDGERHISWNFVASDQALIDEARERWRSGRFDPVPGETEFIPLPER